jgi:hypothetical protein
LILSEKEWIKLKSNLTIVSSTGVEAFCKKIKESSSGGIARL